MTAGDLLARLDGVRKSGNGWLARCPAHDDRNPSLSVREGDRGVLLRCWTGCGVEEIVHYLGIELGELFYDHGACRDPQTIREAARRREAERILREVHAEMEGTVIDLRREAEELVLAARGIGMDGWSDERLAEVLDVLADAWETVLQERRWMRQAA